MGSLQIEQSCIVKFLTLERKTTANIYRRLKKVYQSNVLQLEDVIKLHQKFAKLSIPIQESTSFPECYSIKQEPQDVMMDFDLEDLEVSHFIATEESSQQEPILKRRKLLKPEPELLSTGRSKRKASMKAKETWQQAFNCKSIKEEVHDYIDEDAIETEDPPIMEVAETELETEAESLPEDEDDNEYVRDFSLESIQLPFLPRTDVYSPHEILEALQGSSRQCLLCEDREFKDNYRLKSHLLTVHAKHYVRLDKCLSLLCKKFCKGCTTGHYHCPFCKHITNRDKRLFLHYHRHFLRRRVPAEQQIKLSKVRTNDSICIDPREGLFLVSKSLYVSDQPVHVIVKQDRLQCSDELCEQSMKSARSNGNQLLCKHLQRASKDDVPSAPRFSIEGNFLEPFSLIRQEKERCEHLVKAATRKGVSPVVPWIDDEQVHYYSIFCEAPFATFGRTLVKHDVAVNVFECICPHPKGHFCPYKILAQSHAMAGCVF